MSAFSANSNSDTQMKRQCDLKLMRNYLAEQHSSIIIRPCQRGRKDDAESRNISLSRTP